MRISDLGAWSGREVWLSTFGGEELEGRLILRRVAVPGSRRARVVVEIERVIWTRGRGLWSESEELVSRVRLRPATISVVRNNCN